MSILAGSPGWAGSSDFITSIRKSSVAENPSVTEQSVQPPGQAAAASQEDPRLSPRLRDLALAAVATTAIIAADARSREEALLGQVLLRMRDRERSLPALLGDCLRSPAPGDEPLFLLARELHLSSLELLTVALAAAVEDDLLIGRLLAHVQAPVGGSRPTLGLIAQAFPPLVEDRTPLLAALLSGPAMRCGLLTLTDESAPVPERAVAVPAATCLALQGRDGHWPGTVIDVPDPQRVPLGRSAWDEARRQAVALRAASQRALVVRSGSPAEGRAVAAATAEALNRRPVFVETDKLACMGPWLTLRGLLPVLCLDLSPGERRRLPELPGYDGPVLAVCGPDGSVETAVGATANWVLSVPPRDERCLLWHAATGDASLADALGTQFRHGAGRIAHLGRLARHHAALAGRERPAREDVLDAGWSGEAGGLDSLVQALRAPVPDEALVTPPALRRDLEALLLRCRLRDDLVAGLGASAQTRYRPGMRALFTGPSGTGKTLAAGWIATRLSLPLYRVDLASVTSKYIGETEKNLSQLLARAEQAEVILLFDEADSLFGKRTDISDANDRFANAQTNYLLQRIETYDGIVLLTSNSQARFDPAFTRRLDFTIEFPHPGPEERRALWLSHLGPSSAVAPAELNQLAVLLDLGGGHIRNAVLAAAVVARDAGRHITFADIVAGVTSECRKLGRQLPLELGGRQ
jgi:hypothetical protein